MMQRRTIASFRRDTARRLRANATGAKAHLWQQLKRSPMLGTHFRRQVPIGPYIADFACMAARLIIEVDGSQHGLDAGMSRDAKRTRWLEQEGYRVVRFWNNDVTGNIRGVLEAIYVALYGSLDSNAVAIKHKRQRGVSDHPTPARSARRPSPSRGG
jgi:very-short-patch-repair endonuclease